VLHAEGIAGSDWELPVRVRNYPASPCVDAAGGGNRPFRLAIKIVEATDQLFDFYFSACQAGVQLLSLHRFRQKTISGLVFDFEIGHLNDSQIGWKSCNPD
jgi:hypothetical protein